MQPGAVKRLPKWDGGSNKKGAIWGYLKKWRGHCAPLPTRSAAAASASRPEAFFHDLPLTRPQHSAALRSSKGVIITKLMWHECKEKQTGFNDYTYNNHNGYEMYRSDLSFRAFASLKGNKGIWINIIYAVLNKNYIILASKLEHERKCWRN